MSHEVLIVFAILGGAAVLFATNAIRSDIVAMLVVVSLLLTGILSVQEALAGLADPVVVLLAALFIVGDALVNTGLTQRVSHMLLRAGGDNETRLILLLMAAVAGIGAFMSSTAAVAIFIPVALTIAARADINPRRLMMPLSVAGLISGMMTLIATAPNLVVANVLRERGLEPLQFFSFTPFGILVLIVAAVFMIFVGRSLLGSGEAPKAGEAPSILQLAQTYGLGQVTYLRVQPNSPWHDHTVLRLDFEQSEILVPFIVPGGDFHWIRPTTPDTVVVAGDVLPVIGSEKAIAAITATADLEPVSIEDEQRRAALQHVGVAEIMLTPQSRLIGETIQEVGLSLPEDVTVIAVRRRGKPILATTPDIQLDFGDALLVAGRWSDIMRLCQDAANVVVLTVPQEYKDVAPAARWAPRALVILVAMVAAMASGIVPNVTAALVAALLLLATRCVPLDRIYTVIHWPTILLVAGILPLATALQNTGATHLISTQLVNLVGDLGPYAMLAVVFLVTAMTGLFISNTATAVLIGPIAVDTALSIGASPYAFAMTVAIACSAAYVTPVSSPVNTLVVEPGGYSFMDFVKVGAPLMLLTMVAAVALAGIIYF